jgi:steroid 5-alpha reductase family enzyme
LPQSFFVTSIIGFIISAVLMIYGRIDATWGFAFCMVFVMMFIASFVSITPHGKDI